MQIRLILVTCLTMLLNKQIFSQWNSDSRLTLPICTTLDDQRYPQLISDGEGGAIICWWDDRTTVYAQRVDANGVPLWNSDGIPVCTVKTSMGVGTGEAPQRLVSDGTGGAIIVWTDGRNNNSDLYSQRIDKNGNLLWNPSGVPICDANNQQYSVDLISDGVGGAIITWRDDRSNITEADIYAQRIGGDGNIRWTLNGVPICIISRYQLWPKITSDDNNGAIITWSDYRNATTTGQDIYAQRIDSSGVVQWTSNGVIICNANDEQEFSVICSTQNGGAIIAWSDQRYYSTTVVDIFAQRINSSGTPQWTANGIGVCITNYSQFNLDIIEDNSGGAFLVWEDGRNSPTFTDRDIYAQYINYSGNTLWGFSGVPVCTEVEYQFNPQVVLDGEGGIYIAWEDRRFLDNSYGAKVYLQRLNALGLPVWEVNGIPVCKVNWAYPFPQLVGDGKNGVILAWEDYRTQTNYDIYAQHIDKNTFPGKPYPKIVSVADVPNDTGGKVRVTWTASKVDVQGFSPQIAGYAIWRKIITEIDRRAGDDKSFPFILNDTLGTKYEHVAYIPAVQSETYSAAISTLFNEVDETFIVSAHAVNPNYYLVSSPMVGQSLNNMVLDASENPEEILRKFELFQNYPNPFNPSTRISYSIPNSEFVTLKVYDLLGNEVATLVNEEQDAGSSQVEFNAKNLSSGVYIYHIEAGRFTDTKVFHLIK